MLTLNIKGGARLTYHKVRNSFFEAISLKDRVRITIYYVNGRYMMSSQRIA